MNSSGDMRDVRGAVTPGCLQPEHHLPGAVDLNTLVGQRRARDVAAQLLERLAVSGSAAHGGVQAFALLFGAGNGLIAIVRGGLVPELFGRTRVGRVGGLIAGISLMARAAAPLVAAWLLLALPGYQELMALLAACAAAAWLALWMVAPRRAGLR